jgi:hypothetical protein
MTVLVFNPYPAGDSVQVTPVLVTEFETSRESRNVLHEIIGATDVTVTFKAGGPRSGTLHMLFADAAAAMQCESLAMTPGAFTLSDDEMPDNGMVFVASGRVTRTLDDESRALWLVAIDYTEAAA